jgi:UDP-N-acetyl-2-amino-2-deoxyglucuronate dehydrogenase
MALSRKLGLGIVGAGMAAKPHALSLQALADEIDVIGVYRRDPQQRAAFCQKYGFPEADSFEALLADPRVEAILVLTPPNARESIVAQAAAAEKDILLEKPVERTTAAAERIVKICADAGVKLGVIFQLRFRNASKELAGRIASGALGPLYAVQVSVPKWRSQANYYDQPGRGTLEQDGGGVLMNQAIHTIDLMLSLCGHVRRVVAMTATTGFHRMETEDFAVAGLAFANGAVGSLVATTAHFPDTPEQITLCFEKATAILRGPTLDLVWQDGRTEQVSEPNNASSNTDPMAGSHIWHQRQIADFAAAVREGREPVSTGQTALAAHRLIDAMMSSAQTGIAVELG